VVEISDSVKTKCWIQVLTLVTEAQALSKVLQ